MEFVLNDPHKSKRRREIRYIVTDTNCHICTNHSKDNQKYLRKHTIIGFSTIARYVWYLNTGKKEIRYDEVLMQRCKNRDCINPDHLYIADKEEQIRRKHEEGQVVRHSGLSDGDILEIKKNITETSTELAEKYNVSDSNIRVIWRELTFKYLKVEDYEWYVEQRKKRYDRARIEQTRKANKGRRKK